MKLIEALKQIKELQRKASDLRDKLSVESPVYSNQPKQVAEWIQAHSDILKEILRLRVAIQKTNLETPVTISLGGKDVTKTIAEWVHRRRDLANMEASVWKQLTDRGLKEGTIKQSNDQLVEVKIVRCYEPETRDTMVFQYEAEPTTIDAKLEIVNAVTDLIET